MMNFEDFGIIIIHEEYDDIDAVLLIVKCEECGKNKLDMFPLRECYGDNLRIVNQHNNIYICRN